jgi:hypothetical protein
MNLSGAAWLGGIPVGKVRWRFGAGSRREEGRGRKPQEEGRGRKPQEEGAQLDLIGQAQLH